MSKETHRKKKVYYNISIPHNDKLSVNGSPTPANFFEVRDEPIFKGEPKDWCMSVIRFTIPTSLIPVQYVPIIYDTATPSNPNKMLYSITLSYLGNDFKQNLEWITQDNSVPIPPAPPESVGPEYYQFASDTVRAYYSLYSIEHFCDIINNALDLCYQTNIVPLLPAPTPPAVYKSPFISFTPSVDLFTLHLPSTFLSSNPNPVNLYMNSSLYGNFESSFNTINEGYGAPDGKNFLFQIFDKGFTNFRPDPEEQSGGFYNLTQEFETLGQMTSFTSLIIRSNSLPIQNEALSTQDLKEKQGVGNTIGTGYESLISDFEIDLGTLKNLRGFIHYTPTAEYKRITMFGSSPITFVDCQIFWKDNFDILYPLLIPAHDIITIKIMFEEL